MTAYVLAEIDVCDPVGYEEYKTLSGEAVAEFGGRFLARGGAADLLEGVGAPARVVVLEFPSTKAAQAWYHSELYQRAAAIRQAHADSRFLLVDGLDVDEAGDVRSSLAAVADWHSDHRPFSPREKQEGERLLGDHGLPAGRDPETSD